MGRPKLTLPLGDRTVLEWVIGALQRAQVGPILVVVGPHVPELVPLVERAGAEVLLQTVESTDMRATVEQGLHWLEGRYQPRPGESWLLVPADHPTLDPDVVRQLSETRASDTAHSIVVPVYFGRRGHPALFGWQHVAGIRAMPAGQRLNVYLRQHAREIRELTVASPEILLDLDTPEDYACLKARLMALGLLPRPESGD
jgi:molybdenum cofactor cytidylyltransferase